MSVAIDICLFERLAGVEVISPLQWPEAVAAQEELAALLGHDERVNENAGGPAVYKGITTEESVYPCITFRQNTGTQDGRFGIDTGICADVYYDVEFWTDRQGGDGLTDIAEQVEKLLNYGRQLAPELPLTSGRCLWCQAIVEPIEGFHDGGNLWFSLVRYSFKEQRY